MTMVETMDMTKERMRAIVWQAIAEARLSDPEARIKSIHLVKYGTLSTDDASAYYNDVVPSTAAENAELVLIEGSQRYICWNCCGLRYETEESTCPNCGEDGIELPDEVAFGLRKFEVM